MTRVVFMGTPEFAVPVLAALAKEYQVVGVYTRADKPAGRGRAPLESPVKQWARQHGLPIAQPRTLRESSAQAQLASYRPDLVVVSAYGLILPPAVLDLPARGCLNTHASLLPRWRGASPIPHAILAGDAETGITIIRMDAGVDTGPIIARRALPIASDDTTATLTPKLAALAAALLVETLPGWLAGRVAPTPQTELGGSYAGMVKKEMGLIDWSRPADEIERMVRAYNPWPSTYTYWSGVLLKIWQARPGPATSDAPGTVIEAGREVGVATGSGVLLLRQVQLAGKRALPIDEFVRGQPAFVGAKLG